jgi:hypothetical protein
MSIRRILAHLIAYILCLPLLFGQASEAILVGNIYDPSGAALEGAAVTAEHSGTGVKYQATTNTDGSYRFGSLPAGTYTLTGALPGFNGASLSNVRLEANRTSTVNLTLPIGNVATTVEVREAAALIDTTTANIVTSYNTRQMVNLPLTGFSSGSSNYGVLNLSLLSAGVTSGGGIGYGTGPAIGGQRPTNNNFMIEGIDNNNRSTTGPATNVSNEAVSEFSLQQNQFSADFGHSTGGQFNVISSIRRQQSARIALRIFSESQSERR